MTDAVQIFLVPTACLFVVSWKNKGDVGPHCLTVQIRLLLLKGRIFFPVLFCMFDSRLWVVGLGICCVTSICFPWGLFVWMNY